MSVPLAGLILTALALLVSLIFNLFQCKWRKEERAQHEQERMEAKAEQFQKERIPPEFYNWGGAPHPIRITGSQHSVDGPFLDVSGLITVVNPTQFPVKIAPHRLMFNGLEWDVKKIAFHAKENPRERYERISLVGNSKQDYELHFLFLDDKYPKGMFGELYLTSSNRQEEPFSIPVSFD